MLLFYRIDVNKRKSEYITITALAIVSSVRL